MVAVAVAVVVAAALPSQTGGLGGCVRRRTDLHRGRKYFEGLASIAVNDGQTGYRDTALEQLSSPGA